MDFFDYVIASRRPRNAWERDDCPEELKAIVHLFDDISETYKVDRFPIQNLILIQSFSGSETSVLTTDHPCIVFDVHQLSLVSQVGEFCAFGRVDQHSTLSFFHGIWEDSSKSVDLYGDVEGLGRMRHRIKVQMEDKRREEISSKFRQSKLISHYANSENFEMLFEAVACFIISHEIAHNLFNKLSKDSVKSFVADLPLITKTQTESKYLHQILQSVEYSRLESWQIEELYCDWYAFLIVEKVCVGLNFVSAETLTFSFSLLFGSLLCTSDGALSAEQLAFLQIRSAVVQTYCLSFVEMNFSKEPNDPEAIVSEFLLGEANRNVENFSLVQSLQDAYVKNVCFDLIARDIFPSSDPNYAQRVRESISPVYFDGSLERVLSRKKMHPMNSMLDTISELTSKNDWYMR